MMQGLETFARYFAGDEARYILIGGVATQLVLGEAGLPARATKDLDVVLCVEALDSAFGSKLWAFVAEGGYAVRQQGEQGRCFYRFAKPANPVFPQMLEFFARAPGHMPLAPGAHLTPVPFEQEVQSLSAILLDADYYAFLHAHTVQLAGLHIVTEQALIALKARAWLDLTARKAADVQAVDGKHIAKHRNDVLRLAQLLVDGQPPQTPALIAADVAQFAQAVAPDVTPALLRNLGIDEAPAALLARLRACFGVSR